MTDTARDRRKTGREDEVVSAWTGGLGRAVGRTFGSVVISCGTTIGCIGACAEEGSGLVSLPILHVVRPWCLSRARTSQPTASSLFLNSPALSLSEPSRYVLLEAGSSTGLIFVYPYKHITSTILERTRFTTISRSGYNTRFPKSTSLVFL